ncbi:hypothetical protein [Streptomyces sp. NPDC003023]|uniref:hypothetical protein n=1 Tax=Streptomyces sp. NPDC003023 TaxID=3364675 RepID=UPI0036CBD81A
MSNPKPWRRTRALGALYVGLVAVAAVVSEFAGRPEALSFVLALATFPGGAVLVVLVLLSAALSGAAESGQEDPGVSLLAPLLHAGGALLNFLMLWGAVVFARHFLHEARRSR